MISAGTKEQGKRNPSIECLRVPGSLPSGSFRDDSQGFQMRVETPAMNVPKIISDRVTWCSFYGALAVVFIHCQTWSGMPSASSLPALLQRIVHARLTSFAVPMFFVISGYFFEAGCEVGFSYLKLLRKKAKTLLVPYLLWGMIGIAVLTPLVVVCNLVGGRELLTRTVFDYGSVWQTIDHWIGFSVGAPQGSFPFWYVRVLLIFFLLSPLFCLFGRFPKGLAVPLSLAWAYTIGWGWGVPCLQVRFDVFGWLLLGMCVRRCRWDVLPIGALPLLVSALLYFSIAVGAVFWPSILPYVSGVSVFAGIVFWWGLSERFVRRETLIQRWIKRIGHKTFFIYAIHMMMTEYALAAAGFSFKSRPVVLTCYSFVLPLVVLVAAFRVGDFLQTHLPRCYSLLCGGR